MNFQMPTGEFATFQTVTSLGAFRPKRSAKLPVPYAHRLAYAGSGRHHAKPTKSPVSWFASKLRDLGDALFGSFVTA